MGVYELASKPFGYAPIRRLKLGSDDAPAPVEVASVEIEAERIQVGVNDYASREDARIKARYLSAVEAEARWLQTHGAPPSANDRRRLDTLQRRVAQFFKRADGLVDAEVADIKRQLERETGNVANYDGRLLTFQGQTESLGGAIAARSFGQVLQRIDKVVLEADVGHDSGPRGVRFVDVEVTELWYDPWGEVATFLGTVELAPEGDGWWSAAVRSSPSFLDCSWPDDYELRFIAEDTDGDLDVVTIIR